jgi:molecular chaperone HscB
VNLNQNYFDVFGLPVDFNVDLALLGERYRQLQKEVHPDKFVDGTDQEKRLSMQWATLVNTAQETLKQPLPRAIYMLGLREVTLHDNPVLAPAFLMEQIEKREELEEIEAHPQGIEQLETFKASILGVMKTLEAEFINQIDSDLAAAEQVVYKLQFINKLLHAADHLEEKLLEY